MGRMHYCSNGVSVTDQVVKFQKTRSDDDYIPVQEYYMNYQEYWYRKLSDYLDHQTFVAEYEYKLMLSINAYDDEQANAFATENSLSMVGKFNRWFWRILHNWKSNVKTSSFRAKKRPPVVCPVCGRSVGRIDGEHLQHIKTTKDLPRFFTDPVGVIWETHLRSSDTIYSYGPDKHGKMKKMNAGDTKTFLPDRKKVKWPWKLESKRGVMCPLTKKIVAVIDDEYLMTLAPKFNRYAPAMTFSEFSETYPQSLIQSEIFSLDHAASSDDETYLRETVHRNKRVEQSPIEMDWEQIKANKMNPKFEHAFYHIDRFVSDESDRHILKLVASGYSYDDIADLMKINKMELRKRVKNIRTIKDLESSLREVV